MTDKNIPAFPRSYVADGHNGMTLRDYFAIHAAWEDVRHYSTNSYGANMSRVDARYKYADAMIAARDK